MYGFGELTFGPQCCDTVSSDSGGQPHSRYSLITGRVGLSQVSTSPLGSHGRSLTSPWSHHVVLLNSSANGVAISTMSIVFHFIFMCMCVCA